MGSRPRKRALGLWGSGTILGRCGRDISSDRESSGWIITHPCSHGALDENHFDRASIACSGLPGTARTAIAIRV
jgi:hypothetical protein